MLLYRGLLVLVAGRIRRRQLNSVFSIRRIRNKSMLVRTLPCRELGLRLANCLLARDGAPDIVEYNATQNTVYQGTNLHGINVTHTITGLAQGINLARATNGMLYLPTSVGLQRVDPNNWALPAVTVTTFGGPGYGVNTLPNGNVVYDAGGG